MHILLTIDEGETNNILNLLKNIKHIRSAMIVELDDEPSLEEEIKQAVLEVNQIREGKLKGISARELLND